MKRLLYSSARAAWVACLGFASLYRPWQGPARCRLTTFTRQSLEAAIRGVLKHEPNVALTDEKTAKRMQFLKHPVSDIKVT